ncbi:hypothetical protein B5M09_003629 [Aphanomyces astaci]|nr:hypothetical protein B5M09_003629 [Aphanomyces astaci]
MTKSRTTKSSSLPSPPLVTSTLASSHQLPQDIHALATRLLGLPREGDHNCGSVRIKFNHYNRLFPIHNGVLQWLDVDTEYCFSFVFRGAYTRDVYSISRTSLVDGSVKAPMERDINGDLFVRTSLVDGSVKAPMERDINGDLFVGLVVGDQYEVTVQEDPIAGVGAKGLRVNSNPLFASSTAAAVMSGNHATRLLTQQLRNMHPEMLGSDEAKEIIARRDIEDVLFT